MNDEGNVVVEAVANTPAQQTAEVQPVGDTNIVINSSATSEPQVNQTITQPIGETSAEDIGVIEQPGQPIDTVAPKQPKPLVGQDLNDVQIIEMMSQIARSSVYSKHELNEAANLDSQLYTAIAYNESKNRSLAIDEYHIKRQQAIYDAEHTGYYLAPEDSDMVTQKNMAEYMLNQPNITNAQRTKAQKTIATVQGYFNSKGISMKGVQTLDKIIKDKELDIMRSRNAAAYAESQHMIKSYESGVIEAIYSALKKGDSTGQILARYGGDMDQQDILTIIEGYDKSVGTGGRFFNKIENLTDQEFKLYTKETNYTVDGKKAYEFKYQGKTAYLYEDTITNEEGYKEKVYKQFDNVNNLNELKGISEENKVEQKKKKENAKTIEYIKERSNPFLKDAYGNDKPLHFIPRVDMFGNPIK